MKKVYKGSTFKSWFLNKSNIKRVLIPTRDSFHIVNLDEIEDDDYYIIKDKTYNEVVIEEIEFMG